MALEDLFFSDLHRDLRGLVRDYVNREIRPHADAWEEAEFFPQSVFRRMGELGLLGVTHAAEYGGMGLDVFASIIVLEELAMSGAGGIGAAVAVHSDIALHLIAQYGTEEQKQKYLVPGIAGAQVTCIAVTEPDAGSDVASLRTAAVRDGDGWVLNGAKTFITNGVRADFAVLLARTAPGGGHHGLSHFIVEKSWSGFTVARKLKKVGWHCSDTAELAFSDVRLPAPALLGQEGQGFKQMMWQFQGERIAAAALEVGRAQQALELAMAYAQNRQTFGRALSDTQVIRHKIADMATQVESARRFLYTVAWEVKHGGYPVAAISMCKMMAANIAGRVADEAIQIHGGYGYMQEYLPQRIWRDARVGRIAGGADEIMREIIAKELLGKPKQ